MKRISLVLIMLAVTAGAGVVLAQDDDVDRVTVDLTDPSKPASLEVGLVNGSITVNAYDGKEIVVEATTKTRKIRLSDKASMKASGMTRIPVTSSSLTVEEYRNHVSISTASWKNAVDLVIKVPTNTSLKLSCVNQGDISVEGVSGEIEAQNTNGRVTLLNISGSAVASSHDKDVTVTFDSIDPDKAMSFSSFNGDVDVTFPAGLKAKVKLKTDQGEIFSDFAIEEIENPEKIVTKNKRSSDGKYEVSIDRAFWGTINGGEREIHFTNYFGDIYIRKHK